MADVFISYRKADSAKAEALADALKVENLDVWWDEGLEPGQTFDEKIQSVLEQAKAVIVVWSRESVKSEWVRAESSVGRERGILVPVMIQPVNIPVPFNLIHTADLIGWSGDRAHPGYRDVVKQVKVLAGKQHVKPLRPPPNRQLRALWRTVAAVGVVAAIGASVWIVRPWEQFSPEARAAAAAEAASTKLEADRAKVAPFGVTFADFETLTGLEIATRKFKPETYDQLKALADAGEPSAMALQCAVLQRDIPGREMDQETAADVCAKASDAGDPAGHMYYGDYLTNIFMYDIRIDRDKTEMSATAEYKAAGDLGLGQGLVEYGRRLREGEGVTADPPSAEGVLKAAQAKGALGADFELGMLYFSGKVPGPDPEEAFGLLKKSADAGYPPAQLDLCNKLVGGFNWTEDLDAALTYCKAAATAADPQVSFRAEPLVPDVEKRIAERDAAKANPAPDPATPSPN
jgi:hypothetical protein